MSRREYLECGRIINTHGVGGAVKLESWCDSLETFSELERVYIFDGRDYIEKKLVSASIFKKHIIARIEGVDDFDAAAALKETVLYARREDIPIEEGSYFIVDLIGLPVIDIDSGKKYGEITEVFNAGASDIYTVATENGDEMIPAVPEFVKKIDIDDAVYIKAIEGMFGL